MALYQKYRAKNFSDMAGQSHVVDTILSGIKKDRLVHAYLFTGPRGIGKTSTARLLSKAINCQTIEEQRKSGQEIIPEPCNKCDSCLEINQGRSLDVIEIDAASHTGVDDIRDLIEKANLRPTKSRRKIYIIDEVHMLSKSAFNALLKTLEEPPPHVVFILATTEVHKIPATILSRTQRFDFKRATKEEIIENLKKVSTNEAINVSDAVFDLIAVLASGGHRDALGLLEQLSSHGKEITLDKAREILGLTDSAVILDFLGAIFNENPEEGLKIAHQVFERGQDMVNFNLAVVERLRQILLVKISSGDLFEETEEIFARLRNLASAKSVEEIIRYIEIFVEAAGLLKDVTYPILPIEVAVVKSASVSTTNIVNSAGIQKDMTPVASTKERGNEAKVTPSASKAKLKVADDSLPVPVVEMTRDIWQQVVDKIKVDNATLAALLRDAKPQGMTSDTLYLSVKFKFHKDRISEAKNAAMLQNIVSEVTGCQYGVVCQLEGDKKLTKADSKDAKIDLEAAVTEVFEIEQSS